MPAPQDRNGSYRVLFNYRGNQRAFTIGRVAEAEAKAKAAQVDYLFMRLRQGLASSRSRPASTSWRSSCMTEPPRRPRVLPEPSAASRPSAKIRPVPLPPGSEATDSNWRRVVSELPRDVRSSASAGAGPPFSWPREPGLKGSPIVSSAYGMTGLRDRESGPGTIPEHMACYELTGTLPIQTNADPS